MNPRLRFAAGVLALTAAFTGGFLGYRWLKSGYAEHAPQTTKVAVPAEPAAAARVIPTRVPDVSLADREGQRRKLTEWVGRPLLINFWATWCAPCRREIPLLKQLRREHAAQGLEVLGIAVDFRDQVLEYAREIDLDYPLLIGEEEGLAAASAFGMDLVLPFTIFVDREGRIVTVKVGELHAEEAAFILAAVQEVDSGRLGLPEAQARIAEHLKALAVARALPKEKPTPASAD